MHFSRRSFLKLGLWSPWLVGAPFAIAKPGLSERIAAIIAEYDAQGQHRTGTDVDLASADWMAARIRSLGVEPKLDSFSFERIKVLKARLDIEGVVAEGVPLYDCTFTSPEGIEGSIGEVGSDADIGVMMVEPFSSSESARALLAARRQARHKALVAVTHESFPGNGVATLNAEDYSAPFGPPVLQVPNAEWPHLQQVMSRGGRAVLVAHVSRVPACARNVHAHMPGRNDRLPPLVVMTPRSGWWHCASERGGGIAAFFEVMRYLKQHNPDRSVIFTANTGHELGHTGMKRFLERQPDLVEKAAIWIHLGANFAASQAPGVRLQYVDRPLRERVLEHLQKYSLQPAAETQTGARPFGEARDIFDGGGRYFSILGRNGLFHHPEDRWPGAVDLEVTTRWVAFLTRLASDLASAEA